MNKTRLLSNILLSALVISSIAACNQECVEDTDSIGSEKTATAQAAAAQEAEPEEAKTPPKTKEETTPAANVDPGKLSSIMVGIGADMNLLQMALWNEEFDVIEERALAISDHPKVSESEKKRVLKALGKDMGAFVTFDKAVHTTAADLSAAAKQKDIPKILEHLSSLQSSCASCHTEFRARLAVQ